MTQHSAPLTNQITQSILACLLVKLGILIIGSNKENKAAHRAAFSIAPTIASRLRPMTQPSHLYAVSCTLRSADTYANKSFMSANNVFALANPLFALASKLFARVSHLPSSQLSNPVAPANSVLTRANNAFALPSHLIDLKLLCRCRTCQSPLNHSKQITVSRAQIFQKKHSSNRP
jgi:hypothetical protein